MVDRQHTEIMGTHHFGQKNLSILRQLDSSCTINKPVVIEIAINKYVKVTATRCVHPRASVSLHLDGTLRTKIGLENILQTNCGCDVHLKSLSSSGNLGIRVDRL